MGQTRGTTQGFRYRRADTRPHYGNMSVEERNRITLELSAQVDATPGDLYKYITPYTSAVHEKSNKYIIYTDGACSGTVGAYGFIILDGNGKELEYGSAAFRNTTNNRMEIRGILTPLQFLRGPSHVIVVSDSQYCVNTINNWIFGWVAKKWQKKNLKNVDLWQMMYKRMLWHNIRAVWVRGHNGNRYNELCDSLAETAIRVTPRNELLDCRAV